MTGQKNTRCDVSRTGFVANGQWMSWIRRPLLNLFCA